MLYSHDQIILPWEAASPPSLLPGRKSPAQQEFGSLCIQRYLYVQIGEPHTVRRRLLLHGQEFCTNKMIVTYAHRLGFCAGQVGGWMAVFLCLTDGRDSAVGILRTCFCAGSYRQSSCEWHFIHHKTSPVTFVSGCRDQAALIKFCMCYFSPESFHLRLPCYLSMYLLMTIFAAGAKVKCNILGVKSWCLLNISWEGRWSGGCRKRLSVGEFPRPSPGRTGCELQGKSSKPQREVNNVSVWKIQAVCAYLNINMCVHMAIDAHVSLLHFHCICSTLLVPVHDAEYCKRLAMLHRLWG